MPWHLFWTSKRLLVQSKATGDGSPGRAPPVTARRLSRGSGLPCGNASLPVQPGTIRSSLAVASSGSPYGRAGQGWPPSMAAALPAAPVSAGQSVSQVVALQRHFNVWQKGFSHPAVGGRRDEKNFEQPSAGNGRDMSGTGLDRRLRRGTEMFRGGRRFFLSRALTFEPGRFGMAVRDPMAGHGGLFLWYPSVLPDEGTFSGWIKPDAGLGCGPLFPHIETETASGGKPDYGLSADPDWLGLAICGRRADRPATDADERFGVGRHLKMHEWNHVAVTFGRRETKVYVNGELAATGPGIVLRDSPQRDYLSLVTDLMRIHAPGLLDEFILFNRVLPPGEVRCFTREPIRIRRARTRWPSGGSTATRRCACPSRQERPAARCSTARAVHAACSG